MPLRKIEAVLRNRKISVYALLSANNRYGAELREYTVELSELQLYGSAPKIISEIYDMCLTKDGQLVTISR